MLHNAPSLDISSIILFWKKSRKIDHVSCIDTEMIWNLIFTVLGGSRTRTHNWNRFGFGFEVWFCAFWYRNQQTFKMFGSKNWKWLFLRKLHRRNDLTVRINCFFYMSRIFSTYMNDIFFNLQIVILALHDRYISCNAKITICTVKLHLIYNQLFVIDIVNLAFYHM